MVIFIMSSVGCSNESTSALLTTSELVVTTATSTTTGPTITLTEPDATASESTDVVQIYLDSNYTKHNRS